jgi:hypothetical protein
MAREAADRLRSDDERFDFFLPLLDLTVGDAEQVAGQALEVALTTWLIGGPGVWAEGSPGSADVETLLSS